MKIKLTIFLLSICFLSVGQISTLSTTNRIIITPQSSFEICTEIIQSYVNEYDEIKLELELESKISSSKSQSQKIDLEKDLAVVEQYLELWKDVMKNLK